MFDSVTVSNFMRISSPVTVPLGPVTIIVGENGAGKSSILKGIHWVVRCAALRDSGNRITLERMDYTPSRDFLHLAHKQRFYSEGSSPKVSVSFNSPVGATTIQMNSTRNDAGMKVEVIGVQAQLFDASSRITAYIPGLAGMSEAESLLATPVLHRRAASGEGGSVLRHILLELTSSGQAESTHNYEELLDLNFWVGKVFEGVRFWVKFDRLRDVNIDAKFLTLDMVEQGRNIQNQWKSLEMAGTGFLQVVQIFAYLLHFKPKLLLIDEPDAHLHPGTQEKLIRAIEAAAKTFPETQFMITTHSPSFVRASSSFSNVQWMSDGVLKADNQEKIRSRMGWGALDKELMLITEDGNTTYMKAILAQWPDLERRVFIWPTFGASSLPQGGTVSKIKKNYGLGVVIHRDRDFLSDADKDALADKLEYKKHKVAFWTPAGSDIEAEFCTIEHIRNVFSFSEDEAKKLLQEAINSLDSQEMETDFNTAYASATGGLEKTKVSVATARWRDLKGPSAATIKGKVLLEALENSARRRYIPIQDKVMLQCVQRINIPTYEMHTDLKLLLEKEIAVFRSSSKH